MRHGRLGGWTGAAVIAALVGLGCSGPDVPELRVPTERQHALRSLAERPLSLPEDQPFAIHVKKSAQEPGPDGTAEGGSDATPQGAGLCSARAANGGAASAEFTLGHRIDNQGDAAQSVALQVDFDLKTRVAVSSQPAPVTGSAASLDLLVADGRHRIVARIPVLQGTSETGSADGLAHEQRNLRLRFEGRQSYDVMLVGKANAKAAPGQDAEARLEAGGLKMRLTFTPAASQPATRVAAD